MRYFDKIKYSWQRAYRGYSDEDVWGLCDYLASWLPSAIRDLKKGISYPGYGEASTIKKWHVILENMAKGFEAHEILGDSPVSKKSYKRLIAQEEKGMALFVKWYSHLWD